MQNTLIVFYSYTGVSRRLAELLALQQGWPLGEIVEEHARSAGLGTWRCVLDSVFRRRPAIRYAGPALESFAQVVLISPVWVYRLAGPMRSFVARHRGQLRSYAVLSTMGARGAAHAEAEITRLLGRPPTLAAAITTREVEDGSFVPRVKALGQAIAAGARAVRPVELRPHAT